jgi:hypothetical protein
MVLDDQISAFKAPQPLRMQRPKFMAPNNNMMLCADEVLWHFVPLGSQRHERSIQLRHRCHRLPALDQFAAGSPECPHSGLSPPSVRSFCEAGIVLQSAGLLTGHVLFLFYAGILTSPTWSHRIASDLIRSQASQLGKTGTDAVYALFQRFCLSVSDVAYNELTEFVNHLEAKISNLQVISESASSLGGR